MKNNNAIHFKEMCDIVYIKKAHKSEKSGSYYYLIIFVYDRQFFKAYYKLDYFLANALMCDNGNKIQSCYIDWYFFGYGKKIKIVDIKR